MQQTDDIDIVLTLKPNGWSTCVVFAEGKTLGIRITHVLKEPYSYLISALSALIRGEGNVSFLWYDEPGGHKLDISRLTTQQDKVRVVISEFEEAFYAEPKLFNVKLDFEVTLKQLITIFYFQLLKTSLLLQDKAFAKDRVKDFPFQEFHRFERLVKSYINFG